MRRVVVCVLGLMVLTGACSSSDGGTSGPGRVETVKKSVDGLTATILPAMSGALDGEFPAVRGQFTECGVGAGFQKYSVRGYLQSTVTDNAAAAEKIRAVLADAGLDARIDDDLTVVGTLDDIKVIVAPALPGTALTNRTLAIDTRCRTYSGSDADRIGRVPTKDFTKVATDEG